MNGQDRIRRSAAVSLGLTLLSALATPALASRQPLSKVHETIAAKGPDYVIETDRQSGDVVIRYETGMKDQQWGKTVWVPPNKVEVTIEAAVDVAPEGALSYRYRLVSSPKSRQRVESLVVEFEGAIFDVSSPPAWKGDARSSQPLLIWLTTKGAAAPGQSLGGFTFKAATAPTALRLKGFRFRPGIGLFRSPGALPGIVNCYAHGSAPVMTFYGEAPEGVDKALPGWLLSGVRGKTIGPVAVPDEDAPTKLLGALGGYAKESLALGWIERQETAERYALAVSEIQEILAGGPLLAGLPGPVAGRAMAARLKTLAARVESDRARQAITSEAYALFTYHARYLLQLLGDLR